MEARGVALLLALTGLGGGAGALVTAATGCRTQVLVARSNFVEDGVQQVADAGWDGEHIEIVNLGVTAGGGLALSATDTDRVTATARMLAVADTTDKASADAIITDAKSRFTVTTDVDAGVTTVQCGHGTSIGSAPAEMSGCDALDVAVPTGTSAKRVAVKARSGNGKVAVALDAASLSELDLEASGGSVDVKTAVTQGSIIKIVSDTGDDITLRLPRDFAADLVLLVTSADKIDTSAFPDLQPGRGRGVNGAGARILQVRSTVAGGASGRIVLVAQ
jgi:hypothetical protein